MKWLSEELGILTSRDYVILRQNKLQVVIQPL